MRTVTKLMILEFFSGLCGWLWIIGGFASLFFLAVAISFDGRWSNFIWAVVISVIAKWLAKGFLENKQRVAFEAKLVDEGYTPEEAGRQWLCRYTGKEPIPQNDGISLQEAEKIIQSYGALLAESSPSSGTIADSSKLPYPKQKIRQAILLAIGAVQDTQQKEMLKIGFLQLADFQEGVGEHLVGIDISKMDVGNTDVEELARQVLSQSDGYEKWRHVVHEEREALKTELQNAGHW